MGLFGRNQSMDSDDLGDIDLPNSNDLKPGLFPTDDAIIEPDEPITPPRSQSKPTGYSIEDAIHLMRQLPRENTEVVVTVVKKTLESTNIHVADIIDDANGKEQRIRNRHQTLEEEIKQLEAQISQRNQQISDLLADLKETSDVRERLQLALELDEAPKPQRAAKPEPAAAKPAQAVVADDGVDNHQNPEPNIETTPANSVTPNDNRAHSGHRANRP